MWHYQLVGSSKYLIFDNHNLASVCLKIIILYLKETFRFWAITILLDISDGRVARTCVFEVNASGDDDVEILSSPC